MVIKPFIRRGDDHIEIPCYPGEILWTADDRIVGLIKKGLVIKDLEETSQK